MRHTSARSELVFVLGLAAAGLALVVAVAFTPWYEPTATTVGGDRPAPAATPAQ